MDNSHFSFFESLLEDDKYETLKKEYIAEYFKNDGSSPHVDYDNGIIYENDDTTYDFSWNFKILVEREAFELKNTITKNMYQLLNNDKNNSKYLEAELDYIQALSNKFDKINFGGYDFNKVFSPIEEYLKMRLGYCEDKSYPTFKWNTTLENADDKLTKLYRELRQEGYIEGAKQDFINGFHGKKVSKGIKWLIITNDEKSTNKPNLFCFLRYLVNHRYIEVLDGKDYNDAFIYVFRDFKGNKFERNSLNTSRNNDVNKDDETLKAIINSL